jgi:hypothetical protein
MHSFPETKFAVQYLNKRGIKPETAIEAGAEITIRETCSSGIWNTRLRFSQWGNESLFEIIEEAIWFECKDAKGNLQGYIVRVFPEPVGKDGKPAKFLMTRNGGNYPFILPTVWDVAAKNHHPVFITEGPVKALALQQAGALAVGLSGVWSAVSEYPTPGSFPRLDLHSALADFSWRGRKAFLGFDQDFGVNPSVKQALIRTLIVFAGHGSDARVLNWKITEGKGIDDYFARKIGGKVPLPDLLSAMCEGGTLLARLLGTYDLETTEMDLVRSRLSGISLEQVCRLVAKPLNVTPSGLLAEIIDERRKLDGEIVEPIPGITPRSLSEILHSIRIQLKRYVVFPLPKEQSLVIAVWAAHTWFFVAADYTPYLSVRSPSIRSGKTRLFEILKILCRSAIMTEGATAAALVRMIDEANPPTFLLDEMDTVYNRRTADPNAENMRRFLNAGFKRGAVFYRCGWQGKEIIVEKLPAYCPKAVAAVGDHLPDSVNDRCVPIEIERQKKKRKARKMRDRDAVASMALLRDELRVLSHRRKLLDDLRTARPEMPDELNDRAQDICEPLIAIADEAGENWGKAVRTALKKLYGEQDKERDLNVRLLADIKRVFDEIDEGGKQELSTQILLERLVEIADDAPWADWWEDLLKSGKIKSAGSKLAYRLKRYPIKPTTIRIDEDTTAKGYRRDQFEDAWSRYLEISSLENDVSNVTNVTPLSNDVTSVTSVSSTTGDIKSDPSDRIPLAPSFKPPPENKDEDEDPDEVNL